MTSSNGKIYAYWPFERGIHRGQRLETRSFDVFFDLLLNKRLSKQSWGWRFETLSLPLWRHRNAMARQLWRCIREAQSLVADMRRLFIQHGHRRSLLSNRGGERLWPQNKTGIVHRYQATVIYHQIRWIFLPKTVAEIWRKQRILKNKKVVY